MVGKKLFANRNMIVQLNKRGDTIVEVLIALGIVSLVLTSAYALTSKNVASVQETQEQSTALKLLERQTELLLSADNVPTSPGCFNPDGSYIVLPSTTCEVTAQGQEYDSATDGGAKYTMSITKNGTTGTFVVNAEWVALSGDTANATMHVRRAD